jgi:hypothetical protein
MVEEIVRMISQMIKPRQSKKVAPRTMLKGMRKTTTGTKVPKISAPRHRYVNTLNLLPRNVLEDISL